MNRNKEMLDRLNDPKNIQKLEQAIKSVLECLGEDPSREGLEKTPHRVAQSLLFLTKGYWEDPQKLINNALFHERHDEMIIVKDIGLYSLCEHHMLPFFGKAHVAYIPNDTIIGLSKIARLVDTCARRLQVQERMTQQVADVLNKELKPKGVAVVIEAEHLCMQMRGVQKQGASMVTSAMLGAFREREATRNEFMSTVFHGK